MKFTRNSLIVVVATVLTMLVLLWLATPGAPAPPRASAASDSAAGAGLRVRDAALEPPRAGARYYFDVASHDPGEFFVIV